MLRGNLFDFAIMKTSVISEEFRKRYLSRPGHEDVFEGTRDRVRRLGRLSSIGSTIPSLDIDENCILVIRGSGPLGWPGSAEVVNMQPPDALLQRGIQSLPTLGDGRQSGTSDSPSILNASPESAAGGGLGWLRTGDIDPHRPQRRHAATRWSSDEEIARRKAEAPPPVPPSNTPWEELYREKTGPAIDRRGARVRGQISRHVNEDAAAQSLNRKLEYRRRQHVLIVEVDDRIVGPGVAHARRPECPRPQSRPWLLRHARRRSGSFRGSRRTVRTRSGCAAQRLQRLRELHDDESPCRASH